MFSFFFFCGAHGMADEEIVNILKEKSDKEAVEIYN
jgi:hypothetical protein